MNRNVGKSRADFIDQNGAGIDGQRFEAPFLAIFKIFSQASRWFYAALRFIHVLTAGRGTARGLEVKLNVAAMRPAPHLSSPRFTSLHGERGPQRVVKHCIALMEPSSLRERAPAIICALA